MNEPTTPTDWATPRKWNHKLCDQLDAVDAVHDALEDFTPPEALAVLKIVRANLKAEVQAAVLENLYRGGLWDR